MNNNSAYKIGWGSIFLIAIGFLVSAISYYLAFVAPAENPPSVISPSIPQTIVQASTATTSTKAIVQASPAKEPPLVPRASAAVASPASTTPAIIPAISISSTSSTTTSSLSTAPSQAAPAPTAISFTCPTDETETPTGNAAAVPTLLYHGEASSVGNIPLANFEDQMCALKQAGWQTITLDQFRAYVKQGTPVPEKSFLLTFDDGRADTYHEFDPVLQSLGFNAVMFAITGFSMPDDTFTPISDFYLNQAELASMAQTGRWEIESHGKEDHWLYSVATTSPTVIVRGDATATTPTEHFLSNKFVITDPTTGKSRLETDQEFTQRVAGDLSQSKETLEKAFGNKVIAFAYPYNDYGQETVDFPGAQTILSQIVPSIYDLAFYQVWGNGDLLNHPGTGATMAKRIEPDYEWSGKELVNILDSALPKSLPYKNDNFGDEWESDWGTMVSNGTLSLAAKPNTTGAEAMLNGSSEWKDYLFAADIDWQRGENVTLVARAQSTGEYVKCDFLSNNVVLSTYANQTSTAVTRAAFSEPPPISTELKIGVSGNTASCYSGDTKVVSGTIDGSHFGKGSAGIQIWDPTLGVAAIEVKHIEVEPFGG